MLPHLLIALALLVVVAILALVWLVVRSALGDEADDGDGAQTLERATLLEEKKSILRTLKDLEHERALGKIDDADYGAMEKQLRAQAREVLQALDDDLAPWRAKAEALVAAASDSRTEAPNDEGSNA